MRVNRILQLSPRIAMIIIMNEVEMQTIINKKNQSLLSKKMIHADDKKIKNIKKSVSDAFEKIAPCWPLKNLVAVNPLLGFEKLSFTDAIAEGMRHFQKSDIPAVLRQINRETIKWCQAFFDEGQATVKMPLRDKGLYQCFRQLALYDSKLCQSNKVKYHFLSNLPVTPEQAILLCLDKLGIEEQQSTEFMTLLLTTLPGWASYICYQTTWSQENKNHLCSVLSVEYLAIRIIMTYLLWPKAAEFFSFYRTKEKNFNKNKINKIIDDLNNSEKKYRDQLLGLFTNKLPCVAERKKNYLAQLVFCIDVRSEPFRRAIEAQGEYETFGFAGFFGVPVKINNEFSETSVASCPVLLSPKHIVRENIHCEKKSKIKMFKKKNRLTKVKTLYQMLKYAFVTPFLLVEVLGLWSGVWMLLRTIAPMTANRFKKKYLELSHEFIPMMPILNDADPMHGIRFDDQCFYAENFLRMIGLTQQFAPCIVLCGHGAGTENNAYHAALDCGACGGKNGAPNARILVSILNDHQIRKYLTEKNICIPDHTVFVAALHHTTTDEITIYHHERFDQTPDMRTLLHQLKQDFHAARLQNSQLRAEKLVTKNKKIDAHDITRRSVDWAQTRPEWGLARNAALIVGPRHLTQNMDLEGRVFLHSYRWEDDHDATLLTAILTAPMIVAQWINYQYLFSTLDNIAYGSGSKITQNITGKIAIMQGNASDLMHGLPLQSVKLHDKKNYHEIVRLMTVVYAPRDRVTQIIAQHAKLKNLFMHAWVSLICLDPLDQMVYSLSPDLRWQRY